MLLGFTVTNPLGESLYLSLSEPEKSGLVVRNIDGIGSPTATINMSDYATIDGSRFNSVRAANRNITIQLDYMFDPDIEHSRRKAYRYFPVKGRVELVFKTDYPIEYYTYGYVESNSPSIFSQRSGCTISIKCPDPDFHSLVPQRTDFYVAKPTFEFPFENESLTENLIAFGVISKELIQDIYYTGDQPVGITAYLSIHGETGDITFSNASMFDRMVVSSDLVNSITGNPIQDGDEIVFQTVKGSKFLRLSREENGEVVQFNILGAISEYTSWIVLNPGYNTCAIAMETAGHSEYITAYFQNDVLYEGI